MEEPAEYLVEHVRERLAHDPRVNELDIQVAVAGKRVFLHGHLATPERRELVSEVVRELLPGYTVCNETTVSELTDAAPPETIE